MSRSPSAASRRPFGCERDHCAVPEGSAQGLAFLQARAKRNVSAKDGDGESVVGVTLHDPSAIVALVDELATLAADLWFAGKLDNFVPEEPVDVADD